MKDKKTPDKKPWIKPKSLGDHVKLLLNNIFKTGYTILHKTFYKTILTIYWKFSGNCSRFIHYHYACRQYINWSEFEHAYENCCKALKYKDNEPLSISNAAINYIKGSICVRQMRIIEALKCFDLAIADDNKFISVYINKCWAQILLEHYNYAIKTAEYILNSNFSSTTDKLAAYYQMAVIYKEQGAYNKSIKCFKTVTTMLCKNKDDYGFITYTNLLFACNVGLARCYLALSKNDQINKKLRKNLKKKLKCYLKKVCGGINAMDPIGPYAVFQRIEMISCLEHVERYNEALILFKKLFDRLQLQHPKKKSAKAKKNCKIYFNELAETCVRKGKSFNTISKNNEESYFYLKYLLAYKPDYYQAFYYLGNIFFHWSMYNKALKYLLKAESAIHTSKNLDCILYFKVRCYIKLKKYPEALKYAISAISKGKVYQGEKRDLYNELEQLAKEFKEKRDDKKVITCYKYISRKKPSYVLRLGKLYYKLKEYKEAALWFEKYSKQILTDDEKAITYKKLYRCYEHLKNYDKHNKYKTLYYKITKKKDTTPDPVTSMVQQSIQPESGSLLYRSRISFPF